MTSGLLLRSVVSRRAVGRVSRTLLAVFGLLLNGACSADSSPNVHEIASRGAALTAGKIRVCHFTGNGTARIIEVSANALDAHVAHGDGLAPESVQTNADCLVPQPPPEPVSVAAATGPDGVAVFLVPDTNIRIAATVVDIEGIPLSEITIGLLAIGDGYVAIAQDSREVPLYAPAFIEGTLLDASPGSAPTLLVNFVLSAFQATFPGVGLFQGGSDIPQLVRNHFVTSVDDCMTEDDYRRLLEQQCVAIATAGTARTLGMFFSNPASVPALLIAGGIWSGASFGTCIQGAEQMAALAFSGASSPLLMRTYTPPFLPGVAYFPVFIERVGACTCALKDASTPVWDNGQCVPCSLANPDTPIWDGTQCVSCAQSDPASPIWDGMQCVSCAQNDPTTPVWNGHQCEPCPQGTAWDTTSEQCTPIQNTEFLISVDDFVVLMINGVQVASYDAFPWGEARGAVALAPGWYDIRLEYANRFGSTHLSFYWKPAGAAGFSLVPKSSMRSLDASGSWVAGLRADYSGGGQNFTVFGEGPIRHGWNNLYQGQSSSTWGGVFDANWGVFTEVLTGQLQIP